MRRFGTSARDALYGGPDAEMADTGDGDLAGTMLSYSGHIRSTCDLGLQSVSLTPGASSTCGGGNCSCCSSCCW